MSKKIIFIISSVLLALCMVVSSSAVNIDLSYWDDMYYNPNDNTMMWHSGGGTANSASYPGGTMTYFKMYDGFRNGYIYTITTTARYSGSSVPGYTGDNPSNLLKPRAFMILKDAVGLDNGDIPHSGVNQGVFDLKSSDNPYYDKIKCSVYATFSGSRDVTATYVIEVDDALFYDEYTLGVGFNWAPFQLPTTTTITYTRFNIQCDEVVNESTFYQKNLEALENLQSSIDAKGDQIITSVDNMGNQVSNSIDAMKEQAHQDAETAHQDAETAHQDAENTQEKIENMPSNEHQYVEENNPSSDDIELPDIPLDGTENFMRDLLSVISTTDTDTTIVLPAGNIPFFSTPLWEEQTIDFGDWLADSRIKLLIVGCKGLFSVGALFGIVWGIYSLVMVAMGLKRPSAPTDTELQTEFMYSDRGDGHYNNGKPINSWDRR